MFLMVESGTMLLLGRDDLQVPSSPYFPAYAQGQGPPPMVQERFQSIISQLFQYARLIRLSFVFKIIKVSSFDELVSFFFLRGLFVVVVLWTMIWPT